MATNSSARSYKKDLLVDMMRKNKRLSDDYANQLAEALLNAEFEFGVPAYVLQAIAFVESSYILNAINKSSNDFGIMQVNSFNIDAYNFNKRKLLTDMQYSINAGAKVFRWFYNRYPLEEAIKRYNCGTRPSCVRLPVVKQYLAKFRRAL